MNVARVVELEDQVKNLLLALENTAQDAANWREVALAREMELLAVAEAAGFVNSVEGQSGYQRMSGQNLAQRWRELEKVLEDCRQVRVELEKRIETTA